MQQRNTEQQSRIAQMRVEMAEEEAGRANVDGSMNAMGSAGAGGRPSPVSISQAEYDQLVNSGRLGTPAYAVARLEQLGITSQAGPGGGIQTFAYRDMREGIGAPTPIPVAPVSMAGPSLAEFDQSLYVQPGFVSSAYHLGMQGAFDPNNSWLQRGVNFGLATAAAPLTLVEEFGRSVLNAPYYSSITGQQLAAASLSPTTEGVVLNSLGAFQSASAAFLGFGALTPPSLLMPAQVGMPLSVTSSMSAEQLAAVRSTYDVPLFPEVNVGGTLVKPVDIRMGNPGQVALIGRSMDAVEGYAAALRAGGTEVNVFSQADLTIPTVARNEWDLLRARYGGTIPNDVLPSTMMYQTNENWAHLLVNDNYTVVNLGNPYNRPPSIFFDMEQQVIFGRGP